MGKERSSDMVLLLFWEGATRGNERDKVEAVGRFG